MKKNRLLVSVMAMLMAASSIAACGKKGGDGDNGGEFNGEKLDANKTQVYVFNEGNASGGTWLTNYKNYFEAKYANETFDDGTVGVQVLLDSSREYNASTLEQNGYGVLFLTNQTPTLMNGDAYVDLKEVVDTETLPGESKTIKDKMYGDTYSALTVNGGLYALPHNQALANLTYDAELFNAKGLYYADKVSDLANPIAQGTVGYGLILDDDNAATVKKSCGPDAVYGTSDDGLPSSVEEFKNLVKYMYTIGITPFVCYASTQHYADYLLESMWANLEGYNGTMLYLSSDSTKYGNTDVVKFDGDGKVMKNGDGSLQTESVSISTANATDIYKQASIYEALDFFQFVFNKDEYTKYYDGEGLSSATSNTTVQQKFIDQTSDTSKPVAFLIDGTYWENEAKDAGKFNALKKDYPDYYADRMDFRVFHLPTQYLGRVAAVGTMNADGTITPESGVDASNAKRTKQTAIDTIMGFAMLPKVNLKTPSAIKAAKLFVRDLYTDENLVKFTQDTGMMKASMQYSLTADQQSKLSKFYQDVYRFTVENDVVEPISNAALYAKNPANFSLTTLSSESLFSTKVDGSNEQYPIRGFREKNYSVDTYFKGIIAYHDSTWYAALNK